MRILIVGGGLFLGRRLIDAALSRGHEVTTFTRGVSTAVCHDLPYEQLVGDRHHDLSRLEGRRWNAVIDTCGYVPGAVTRVMSAIDRAHTDLYTFISTISVYADAPPAGVDERAPVGSIASEQVQEAEETAIGVRPRGAMAGELYGPLKALCERAAEEAMPGRVLVVRPGLIVGPDDYSDRFTYWARRIADGGDVLAPGRPERRVRVIDARDLAEWIVRMIELRATGVFNASGAEDGLTFCGMLETCRAVGGSDARLVWVDETFLLDRGVAPWSDLPLWLPDADNGIFEARNDKAIAAGLTFRPLADTVRATLEWDRTRARAGRLRAGLPREREHELLESWSAEFSTSTWTRFTRP